MKTPFALAFIILLALSGPVSASTPTIEATQTCLSDSTNGKDRKLLARWIFFAMVAHPEFKGLTTASAQEQKDTSREFAGLVTRLMTVDCRTEIQALVAADADAGAALKIAFSHLGQVAMQELMANKDVEASISQFGEFIDEEKLAAVLGKKISK
jgi:thiamine monophosphate synthase